MLAGLSSDVDRSGESTLGRVTDEIEHGPVSSQRAAGPEETQLPNADSTSAPRPLPASILRTTQQQEVSSNHVMACLSPGLVST